jgi:hypothetical protein
MLFLIHAACGFGCGVLTMHLLTIGCNPRREIARKQAEKPLSGALVPQ